MTWPALMRETMTSRQKKMFFNKLALELGLVDVELTEKYYHGFIRFILRTLKEYGIVQLPGLGHFILRRVNRTFIGLSTTVFFRSIKKVRIYFKDYEPGINRRTFNNIKQITKEKEEEGGSDA